MFMKRYPSEHVEKSAWAIVVLLCMMHVCRADVSPSPSATNMQHRQAYSCILHVHSEMSEYGQYSLEQLTDVARRYGVDAIFLTDNLTDTIEYGAAPLRHVLWANYSRKSILTMGPANYLAKVEKENTRQSDVLYVPGVEICPRFYWTGSLPGKDLTCHNHQRNLIALSIRDARVLAQIPEACGFIWQKNPIWVLITRLSIVLLALALVGLFFLPRRLARASSYSAKEIRRSIALGIILPLLILTVGVNVAASLVPSFRIYGEDKQCRQEQRTVDFLKKHGVLHYWAHPEAGDDHNFQYLGIHFKAHTEPYPELLAKTDGYTGFGGVYEDKNTLTDAGSGWDAVLREYASGTRTSPVWCFGEMLYHYEGQAGKKLGNVETMVWAGQKTETALLQSIGKGDFYARYNGEGQSLTLDEWRVERKESNSVDVVLSVSSRVPGEQIQVQLIRNGEVVLEKSGATPLAMTFPLTVGPGPGMSYYRAVVHGRYPLKLVTNPIFISE